MNEISGNIFVVGGARGIGWWFCDKFLSRYYPETPIIICDVDLPAEAITRTEFDWVKLEYSKTGFSNFPYTITKNDIVIFSVPIDVLEKVALSFRSVAETIPTIVNFCSVQNPTNLQLSEQFGAENVFGVHLMFGPKVNNPAGNAIVITDAENNNSDFLHVLKRNFVKAGFFVEISESSLHDEMMNIVQTGVHYLFFAFASFLEEKKIKLSSVLKYQTLPGGVFLSFMARALAQDKRTYANIQNQVGASETRSSLVKSLVNLNKSFTVEKNLSGEVGGRQNDEAKIQIEKIEERLKGISSWFDREEIRDAVAVTRVAIEATEHSAVHTNSLIQSKQSFTVLLSGYKRKKPAIYGRILRQNRTTIFVENQLSSVRKKIDGEPEQKYYLIESENTDYLACCGLTSEEIETRRQSLTVEKIKKDVMSILPRFETKAWISENLVTAYFDTYAVFPAFNHREIEAMRDSIVSMNPEIVSLNFSRFSVNSHTEVEAYCTIGFVPPLTKAHCLDIVARKYSALNGSKIAGIS